VANKALKGLTIKIGGDTSELTKALDGVEKQGRSLSGELGQINKLLKLDPKNTELLAQKQKVLAGAISSTEKRLDTLKEAEKQAQEQFAKGDISEEQYRALQREIIATENKLDKYKKAAKETEDAVENLGKESGEAADKIEEQGKETEKTKKETEDLDDSAGDLAKGGLAALAGAAVAATTAIVALAEGTREYRTAMNRLDVAFQDAGFSAETATQTYEELQSVLGETDQAVEASNLLAKFCDTEEELKEMTHALTGVFATFPDSLPIEALAESANETARTGQIAGNLADALNWAAAEGETFGVKMRKATEANEEWNKKVEEATSAEDYFNLALEECTTQQERQQLITKTLTDLYGNAAEQYKKTNAEIIRSNQATEKWNKATAKIGKTVEPVMTDFKELGVTLLEDFEEPLEDTADFIRTKLIPAIKNISSWTKQNLPAIKAGLAGVATAMVALKVASIATTVAQKGLKTAIKGTTVAQKALALAQKATPWGLALTAITAVTAAMLVYVNTTKKSVQPVDALTKEEKELVKTAQEAAAAFRDQKKATDENLQGITAQMGYIDDLVDELDGLTDASGKVKETDQERAQFILNELNDALGTEYKMVGGVIQQYQDLKKNIEAVIKTKKANLLLEAAEADYTTAITEKNAAYESMTLAEKDYIAQLEAEKQREEEIAQRKKEIQEELKKLAGTRYEYQQTALNNERNQLDQELEDLRSNTEKKKAVWEDLANNYNLHVQTIINYEDAQAAVLAGNYEQAVELLQKEGGAHAAYADTVGEETARVLATLEQKAYDAGEKAKLYRENFEKGVSGYTEEMVKEAEEGYKTALGKFASAYSDAYGLGEDFGQGLADGIKIKNGAVGAAAIAQIREAVKAAKKEAEINSPSKKTMAIGEGMGEGAEVGIEHKTKDVERAATNQAAAILDAYSAQELAGQRALRSVADQQAARQATIQTAAAASNATMLEKILAAIQEGQVLTLDGDTLVGATANRMDTALGQRRALASRGAI